MAIAEALLTWYGLVMFFDLSFKPKSHCFSKAQIKWRGLALNATVAPDKPQIDLSDENLAELIDDLFGQLEFIEIANLHKSIEEIPALAENMSWPLYFKKQGLHFNQRTSELFQKISTLPEDFKNWAYERKLSSTDLMPINSLNNLENFSILSSWFSELQISRNDGKKIIDILIDLLLLEQKIDPLIPKNDKNWFKQLYQLRYPQTITQDQKTLKNENSWPEFVRVSNKRQGDQLSYQMQIQYSNASDLSKKLTRLVELGPQQ